VSVIRTFTSIRRWLVCMFRSSSAHRLLFASYSTDAVMHRSFRQVFP